MVGAGREVLEQNQVRKCKAKGRMRLFEFVVCFHQSLDTTYIIYAIQRVVYGKPIYIYGKSTCWFRHVCTYMYLL